MQRWISVLVLFATAMVGCATPYRGAHESYEGVSVRLADVRRDRGGADMRFVTTSTMPESDAVVKEVAERLQRELWDTHEVVIGSGPDGRSRPVSRGEMAAEFHKRMAEQGVYQAAATFSRGEVRITGEGAETIFGTTFKGPVETVWILPKFATRLGTMFPGIRVSTEVVRVTPAVSPDAAASTSSEPAPAR